MKIFKITTIFNEDHEEPEIINSLVKAENMGFALDIADEKASNLMEDKNNDYDVYTIVKIVDVTNK